MSSAAQTSACARAFYSAPIARFLQQSEHEILGQISAYNQAQQTTIQQNNSWEDEIKILKNELCGIQEGHILFEYTIPRMGKRVDVVILHSNIVFLLEFKCGACEYTAYASDQVLDYALDLRHFHKASHDKLIACLTIADKATAKEQHVDEKQRIISPIRCNAHNIRTAIEKVAAIYNESSFDYQEWTHSEYLPTPTIVEAAQALYQGHKVSEITRSDAGKTNLTTTTAAINGIIKKSKANKRKSICFVTGVPGAGKTLVGLNIAIDHAKEAEGEHAVFLSGNYPLVTVLQEALARDKTVQSKESGQKTTKKDALRETAAFIQIIHKYRDEFVGNDNLPPERIVIFDEAQRAWTHEQIAKFMRTKKKVADFPYSEPEFLISTMNRHRDWAVVICLIGGGQEINTGEAGLPEWFDSLQRSFADWDVYLTPQLNDSEYRHGRSWQSMIQGLNIQEKAELHLASSVRSFRTPALAAFIKALLDINIPEAQRLHAQIEDKYPIVLTRHLPTAKKWVREQCRGNVRYGLLASSGALRLKPEGIFIKNEVTVANWFLNGKDDVRSSFALEDTVSEFDIQGLELDYTIVAWDADLRYKDGAWTYNNFSGAQWQKVRAAEKQLYLKNAYRVLLTRARQGMVIFIPEGCSDDPTRNPKYYDGVYHYLKQLGIQELS